jgi:hypothetical protein
MQEVKSGGGWRIVADVVADAVHGRSRGRGARAVSFNLRERAGG